MSEPRGWAWERKLWAVIDRAGEWALAEHPVFSGLVAIVVGALVCVRCGK